MKKILIFIILLSSCIFISPANAEGSRELVANGGYRPYLGFSNVERVGIKVQTNIKVYVNAGEQINLGSSVPISANGSDDIVYISPFGGQDGSCNILETGFGLIDTLAKELAGPLPNTNGYTPCTITATETGVYEIEFRAPIFKDKYVPFPGGLVTTQFPIDSKQGQGVAAWDVTVFKTPDDATTEQKGRVYANYLPLDVGKLKRGIYSITYFLTSDGYLYRSNLNGMEPYGFIFFANDKGIRETNGEPLNKSVHKKLIEKGTYDVHNPGQADTTDDVTHKMFFNLPDSALPLDELVDTPSGQTWLRSTIEGLPVIGDFKFTGDEGSNGYAGTVPLQGSFSFNVDRELKYFLTIDLNNNGVFGDDIDVMLLSETVVGANKIEWDGIDGNGDPAPPKEATYNAKFNFMLGNIHFPFWDVENDPNGFILERLDCDKSCDIIYYNHSDLGPNVEAPDVISALDGISSHEGKHAFSNNYGDNRVLDIWTFPNDAQEIEIETTFELKEAHISVSKTHTTDVKPLSGGPVTYIITVQNDGPSDANGIGVKDSLPSTVTDPPPLWSCTVSNSIKSSPAIQNGCSQDTGEGPIDITVDLQNGGSATIEVVGTITAEVGDTVTNSVSVTRPKDITNPNGDVTNVSHSFVVAPPDNIPPVAVDKATTTDNATPVQIPVLEASDTDGTVASYTVYDLPSVKGSLYLGEPSSGTLLTEGQILTPSDISNIYFMPVANSIDDVTFHYTATDDQGDASNQATVTITITAPPANEPPVADDKTVISTPNDTTVQVNTLSGSDTDGTVEFFNITLPPSSQGILYLGDPDGNGTPIFIGQDLSPAEATNIYFKPNPSFIGQAEFTYTATDNNGSPSQPATVTIPVTDSNKPPIAEDKQAPSIPNNITEQLPALEATDTDGTVESYQIKTLPLESEGKLYLEDPAKGGKPIAVNETLTPEQVKNLYFQPNSTFSGDASFTYVANDNSGAASNVATVTMPVTTVPNNPPTTSDTSGSTDPNVPVTLNILG
ncbi:MAG: DUF11 domain-containing protein, partial [Candidatus Marithrix sp.]|nr:DUF11 domain-containing protein [Candidatus Marithrix sp.]